MGNTSSTTTRIVGAEVETWRACTSAVRAALSALEPRDLTAAQVNTVLAEVITLERLAGSARLLVSKAAAETEQWRRDGFRSAAEWLAAQQGTSTGKAHADLGAAERLADLGDTREALRDGRLSPDQATAISEAAVVNPDAQGDLIRLAQRDTLRRLKEEAARRRAEREDVEARRRRVHARRRARAWTDADGAWNLAAAGTPDAGSGFVVEWERLTDERFATARASGERGSREQYAFDALIEMATRSHRLGSTGSTAGRDGPDLPAAGGATGATPRRESLRHLALIRVDLTALRKGGVDDGELCEIAGVGPISVEAARELLGESILKLVMTNGVDVVNVTHLGRGPTIAQEVALLWGNPVCCVEGCNRTRRLQWDHRRPWAEARETVLSNLNGPCEFHHAKKTREGWELIDGTGRRPMVPPCDPRHPRHTNTARSPNAPPAA